MTSSGNGYTTEPLSGLTMSDFASITQNDESQWDDIKGDLYHYPATYQGILARVVGSCITGER